MNTTESCINVFISSRNLNSNIWRELSEYWLNKTAAFFVLIQSQKFLENISTKMKTQGSSQDWFFFFPCGKQVFFIFQILLTSPFAILLLRFTYLWSG